MALSVDYLYQFCLKLIRKNQSGTLTATEFQFHWNDHQSAYFDDLAGRFQAQNPTKEGINTGLIQNKTILQKLSPFTKKTSLTIASGTSDKPEDFIFEFSIRINGYDVIHINQDQIASVNNSTIDPPSVTDNKYYVSEYEDYYSFLPTSVTSATLDYLFKPPNVVWAFNYDSSNRQIYNEGLSTQPLWDDHSCREITKRMLKNLGVSYKDNDFMMFGESVIQKGE